MTTRSINFARPGSGFVVLEKLLQKSPGVGTPSLAIRRIIGISRQLLCNEIWVEEEVGNWIRLKFWRVPNPRDLDSVTEEEKSLRPSVTKVLLGRAELRKNSLGEWRIEDAVTRHLGDIFSQSSLRKQDFGIPYCETDPEALTCAEAVLLSVGRWIGGSSESVLEQILGARSRGSGMTPISLLRAFQQAGIASHLYSPRQPDEELIDTLQACLDSGAVCILGFDAGPVDHVVLAFAYTHNKNTWLPVAGHLYEFSDDYVNSEETFRASSWISSFYVHDSNTGMSLAIPREFVTSGRSKYIIACGRTRLSVISGLMHNIGRRFALSALRGAVATYWRLHGNWSGKSWLERINNYVNVSQELAMNQGRAVVLRLICSTFEDYLEAVLSKNDWKHKTEGKDVKNDLSRRFAGMAIHIVEFSSIGLYGTNMRKLGEVVYEAVTGCEIVFGKLLFVRLPGCYFFPETEDFPRSSIEEHVQIWGRVDRIEGEESSRGEKSFTRNDPDGSQSP